MTRPVFALALRLRLRSTASASVGLVAVLLIVGALFPAVGHSFSKFHLPTGVSDLLGGADYGTVTGWYRAEIASFYGPLLVSLVAITGAVGSTAGEEESGILALLLAQPLRRSRYVVAKAGAVAVAVLSVAVAAWIGLIAGVALAHGGISVVHLGAYALHLAFFGLAIGAVALALGAATGRPGTASGVAAAVAPRRLADQRLRATRPLDRLAEVPVALLLLRGQRSPRTRRRDGSSRRSRPGRAHSHGRCSCGARAKRHQGMRPAAGCAEMSNETP
jgi:ABC-2 type transport system permease protein